MEGSHGGSGGAKSPGTVAFVFLTTLISGGR